MKRRRTLRSCARGSTLVEFAFAAPILIMLMIGILQVAVALHAAGGIRNAIGEGVRFAKVHRDASQEEVAALVRSNLTGVDRAKVSSLVVERGLTASGAAFARITIAYEPQVVIPFLPPRTLRFEETRRVYLPA